MTGVYQQPESMSELNTLVDSLKTINTDTKKELKEYAKDDAAIKSSLDGGMQSLMEKYN